jgi:hypothetical protein
VVLPSLSDAIIVVILLVPGFVAFSIIRRLGAFGKGFSEFETVAWSVLFTIIVFMPFTAITGLTDFDKIRDGFLYPYNIAVLFISTLGVGFGIGTISRRLRKHYSQGDPWEILMTRNKNGSWVTVITKDGKEYMGWYFMSGIGSDKRELVLLEPSQILREPDGDYSDKMRIGDKVIFKEDDIARIFFYDRKKDVAATDTQQKQP